ncbi:basic secretory protein-like protein [Pedobacter punctiformis]|uniref:Basic secretory protein-like protein n=1 Tax=Pedobacter punctiformis TaxID=3004097 RepID=A0ABT4LFA6_9SPHI|nr:basic secretory protein-like protein [Pedobacter sp. HCMS5-2]MCZ4245519.1 basic secretory protein-like protein [Pedobacter sp. HCMS5-2]
MKKIVLLSILALLISPFTNLKAQETIKKNGYTLTFESNFDALNPQLKKRLMETFFIVYPKLAKEYNPKTLKAVKFFVDTAYKGVAATSDGKVTFSSIWMVKHPEDIDVVTHEVMHIVQDYGNSVGPGWLTEGIADYARYKFGVDNEGAKWALPALKPEHSYKNSYRITARFFAWIEKNVKAGTIKTVDASLRDHSYTNEIWTKLTGKDLDALWADYVKNPAL